jgi:hypothetical protein
VGAAATDFDRREEPRGGSWPCSVMDQSDGAKPVKKEGFLGFVS